MATSAMAPMASVGCMVTPSTTSHVIDARERLGLDDAAHERLERRGVALPRLHGRLPGEDGPRQHEGRLALLRAQVGVTRAFGQTVSLAHDGTADDGHVHVQVGHHALDDGELLGVLLPEKSAMRLHDVEELRDHRAHAAEVPRARGAAQRVGERFHDHEGVVGRGVHVVHFRWKTTSTPWRSQMRASRSRSRG